MLLSLTTMTTSGALTRSYTSEKTKLRKTFSCSRVTSRVVVVTNKKSNYYKLLSLESENVGFDEIKKAYRSMALRYHPDVCHTSGKEESTKMFVELHQAYLTLSDYSSRKAYDMQLLTGEYSERVDPVRSEFSRETWESQLQELVRRSERREREKGVLWREN